MDGSQVRGRGQGGQLSLKILRDAQFSFPLLFWEIQEHLVSSLPELSL